jgi:hypothetical protein
LAADSNDAGTGETSLRPVASAGSTRPDVGPGSAEHPRGGSEIGTAEFGGLPDMLSAWVAAAAADAAQREAAADQRPKLQPFDPFPDPPSGPPAFWAELKRREIFQGILVYALIAFGVLYAMDVIIPALGLPHWAMRASIIAAIAGWPVALAIDWLYDLTPEGVRREVPAGHVGFAPSPARWPRILAVVAIAFVLAVVSFGMWLRLFNN